MTRKDATALLREEKSRLNFDGPGDETDRLIIGLDFGTTYSGLAYVFTLKPDQVYTSTDRPVAKGRVVPKALSTMKYSDPDTFQWSYELDRTMKEKIEGIKLLLDPYQEKPLHISLRGDRVQEIRKIEGKYLKSFLELLEKQFILLAPAIWSDKAKDATLKAVGHAGIHPITPIKKPEAAALRG